MITKASYVLWFQKMVFLLNVGKRLDFSDILSMTAGKLTKTIISLQILKLGDFLKKLEIK